MSFLSEIAEEIGRDTKRIMKLEAALQAILDHSRVYPETKTVTCDLEVWEKSMAVLKKEPS